MEIEQIMTKKQKKIYRRILKSVDKRLEEEEKEMARILFNIET